MSLYLNLFYFLYYYFRVFFQFVFYILSNNFHYVCAFFCAIFVLGRIGVSRQQDKFLVNHTWQQSSLGFSQNKLEIICLIRGSQKHFKPADDRLGDLRRASGSAQRGPDPGLVERGGGI